ncbi:MAG: toxin-antitoxin system HicB family antitoxin [Candidatus Saccharimonas sp.]|nr:toxin-antitoxin system HicB family antitoxin [Planctomycetaceae bacterium]
MSTATKSKASTGKSVAKTSKLSPAQQVLGLARAKAEAGATWTELHNALFGIGGLAAKLFTTPSARTAFSKTSEHADLLALIDAAPDGDGVKRPAANGKLLIRLPKSLHSALIVEAEAEDTSINQLVVAKLSAQLRAVV